MRAALLALLLAGCALSPARHDPVEQVYYVDLRQIALALDGACGRPGEQNVRAGALVVLERLALYTEFSPDEEGRRLAQALGRFREDLLAQGSVGFCQATAKNLGEAAARAQRALWRRER